MVEGKDLMKIGIVGLGYVGLVTAAVLADQGNEIVGVDTDPEKIEKLRSGKSVIFEPGLDELLSANVERLEFSSSYEKLLSADAIFICVSTPDSTAGIDLKYVFSAFESLRKLKVRKPVAIKSTVIPGTAGSVLERTGIGCVSNPEFLREGTAIHDSVHPERVVIGGIDKENIAVFREIWKFTSAPVIETTNENAELIKYASNSFLAVKISFINEIANLCELIPECDVNIVAEGMGLDPRISPLFLRAGLGFGGSCLPKDTRAILKFSDTMGAKLQIVDAAIRVNNDRVHHAVERIEKMYGSLGDRKVCILGIAFKDDTDDVRYSKSWELAKEIESRGARVRAYDPVLHHASGVEVAKSPEECMKNSDFIIIGTEWNEFRNLNFETPGKVIDLRRLLDVELVDLAVGKHD